MQAAHTASGSMVAAVVVGLSAAWATAAEPAVSEKLIRVGIIGLDTSQSTAFTKLLNDTADGQHVAGCRGVAASPQGSPDIESSFSRVPEYTAEVKKHGVEIVAGIPALLG